MTKKPSPKNPPYIGGLDFLDFTQMSKLYKLDFLDFLDTLFLKVKQLNDSLAHSTPR